MGNEGYVAHKAMQFPHHTWSFRCFAHHTIGNAGQLLYECRDRSAGINETLVAVDDLAIG